MSQLIKVCVFSVEFVDGCSRGRADARKKQWSTGNFHLIFWFVTSSLVFLFTFLWKSHIPENLLRTLTFTLFICYLFLKYFKAGYLTVGCIFCMNNKFRHLTVGGKVWGIAFHNCTYWSMIRIRVSVSLFFVLARPAGLDGTNNNLQQLYFKILVTK